MEVKRWEFILSGHIKNQLVNFLKYGIPYSGKSDITTIQNVIDPLATLKLCCDGEQ